MNESQIANGTNGHERNNEPLEAIDLGRYESFAYELVQFAPTEQPNEEAQDLIRDIVVLDHRSLHALKVGGPARAEVRALLQNAVICAGFELADASGNRTSGGMQNIRAARGLFAEAEEMFTRHLQAKNRMTYLVGVLLSVALIVVLSIVALPFQSALFKHYLPTILMFAGLGSMVSVLLRLSKLDLVKEVSRAVLLVSGFARAFVAAAFGIVLYLVLISGLIAVKLAEGSDTPAFQAKILVVAFLCGFSERFAQDILDRVQIGSSSSSTSGK